ncbi:MAG: DUF4924 family protein [Bacteroidales bacterium]|nr:DUF4924 family protein [Bacteroidales bacterium]
MLISRQKKQENIAEYVLYMWQIEDLIRAYGLDLVAIEKEIISQFDLDDETNAEMVDWYDNLIQLMLNEKVTEKGHLQIVQIVITDLTNLHFGLLNSSFHPEYKSEFEKLAPYLADLLKKVKDKDKSFVEICFEALYGILMLKLAKQKISKETEEATIGISSFISLLSEKYHAQELDADFVV